MQNYLRKVKSFNTQYDRNITTAGAWLILRKWLEENIEPAIVKNGRKKSHRVIFTPPHFSDLQTIELFWARVKGAISRISSNSSTFEDVKNTLQEQFEILDTESGRQVVL